MLKYYFDKKEITSEEYVAYLVDDAYCCGETKTAAMRIVRENRQEAREEGESIWYNNQGNILAIRNL